MSVTKEQVLDALKVLRLPDGRDVVSADFVRALSVDGGQVRFVLEVPPELGLIAVTAARTSAGPARTAPGRTVRTLIA